MENTLDLENGMLSFTNPNYNPSDVNSNISELESPLPDSTTIYENIYEEIDAIVNLTTNTTSQKPSKVNTRRTYANLDTTAMGIVPPLVESKPESYSGCDRSSGSSSSSEEELSHSSNNLESRNNHLNRIFCMDNVTSDEFIGKEKTDDTPEVEKPPTPSREGAGRDVYAIPNKVPYQSTLHSTGAITDEILPLGWEKHEDESGPYYWHISSGTIQREPPKPVIMRKTYPKHFLQPMDSMGNKSPEHQNNSICKQLKRRSYPEGASNTHTADKQKPIRFAVRSLGWVEIAETDLTPERSSKAVNKCIVDLSLGRNDILDVVGRWGDGKDLYMDLDDYSLRLIDPQDMTILNTQHIHSIRVWGVGRDNGRERDFAYVVRDRASRKHMCHVFRCDIPARIIANTLRDICKKIMLERNVRHSPPGPLALRPTSLSTSEPLHLCGPSNHQFPTPMEEPKKILKVQYLGSIPVAKATGMEILNGAIDTLAAKSLEYKPVYVAVAPSTITITEAVFDGELLAECRVRFLSFLGIGHDVKYCGFIIHTARDHFIAHVFHCEPSSGAMCKTIEAACKLRYQKCLDAHREVLAKKKVEAQNKGIATALRSVFGSLTTRLIKSAES